MSIIFGRATKAKAKLRMAIDGPSGSGKTYTALIFATALANEGKVAVIDTERGSSTKYSDLFAFDVIDMRDAFERDTFSPEHYRACIEAAEAGDYDVLVIDSLSHAWSGEGGALSMVDAAATRSRSGNSYAAWREVTPEHNKLVDAMLQSSCHIIVTMRSKMEYVLEADSRGKQVPRKVGMAPVQRQDMEYEFDIVMDLDDKHTGVVSKTRCAAIDNDVVPKPDAFWFGAVRAWLSDGVIAPEKTEATISKTTTVADWPKAAQDRFMFDLRKMGLGADDMPKLLKEWLPSTSSATSASSTAPSRFSELPWTETQAQAAVVVTKHAFEQGMELSDVHKALGMTIGEWVDTGKGEQAGIKALDAYIQNYGQRRDEIEQHPNEAEELLMR